MKQSRAYQTAIENEIPRALRDHGAVIVQAPTGAGKSHIINQTVKRIIAAGKIPLVLSDSIKIHGQLLRECNAIRLDSTVKWIQVVPGYCHVAMTQTLRNRPKIIMEFRALADKLVIIVDEAHRNTMTPLIEEIMPEYLIGFTATPHYRWAKHLPKLYNCLIHGPQISQLVRDGFLCHYRHLVRTGADLNELEFKGAEYSEESQERVFGASKLYDGLFEDLPLYQGKKTVIYVASIKQCEQMYEKLKVAGYAVTRYHSELPNRDYELAKFTQTHECDVCVSVGSLTLGWDFPPIDLVVFWRSTTSLPLYLQIGGRGSRPYPGKDMFTVLDYGGNFERFGGWDMDRDWNELWQDPKKKRKVSTYAGVGGSKLCPVCQAILPIAATACYNCGYMYPAKEVELIEGQLLEVQNTLDNLKNKRVGDLTAEELANYAKLHDKRMYSIRIAKRKEQDAPGFLDAFARAMGYESKWVRRQKEQLPKDKIIFFNLEIR